MTNLDTKAATIAFVALCCGFMLSPLAIGGNQTTREGFWAGSENDGWNYASVQCVDGQPALIVNRKKDKGAAIAIFVDDDGRHTLQLTKDGKVRMIDLWSLGELTFESSKEGPEEPEPLPEPNSREAYNKWLKEHLHLQDGHKFGNGG